MARTSRKQREVRISAERKAREERTAKMQAETRAAVVAGCCPKCKRGIRELTVSGWWQCEQYGAPGFRKDPSADGCDWYGFTY